MTNLIILDASRSMQSKKDEVIGGLKESFKQIKNDYKEAKKKIKPTTIVVDFSSPRDFNVLVNSKNLSELTDEVAEKYDVRSMTALYDAIGKGFELVSKKEKDVFVTIMTDGEENSSQEFKSIDIKNLIAEKKLKGWAITFMGTTEAAIGNAVNLGISRGNTFAFADNSMGVMASMSKMSSVRGTYYNAKTKGLTLDEQNLMGDE